MKDHSLKEEVSGDQQEVLINKFCLHCKTTKTPMWRIGPSGPKSLCNACGIKFRKNGSDISKVKKESLKEKNSRKKIPSDESQERSKNGWIEDGAKRRRSRKDLKMRLRGLSKEVVVLRRQRSVKHQKMDEVEQAALLLMALSCGSVFAQKSQNNKNSVTC